MARLGDAEIAQALATLPGWSASGGEIRKTFDHPSFPEAIVFVNAVAQLAEVANHHPDVDIRYTRVTLALTTHDAGGLTAKDVALARAVEEVRRKAGVA